ncbi:hypothetical protein XENOCAPTIV_016839 [Xenoophorus captivus]|uniref:Neuron navigator 2 n=1 Tax=Xenoophorus captivus TaxID=1517983 RepID=A0ABV0RCZ1_9TELE
MNASSCLGNSVKHSVSPAGKTDDVKVSEKGRLSPRSNGLQRSPSDAGRSSSDEAKKQSIPTSRTTTANPLTHTISDPQSHTHMLSTRTPTSAFGFKKQGPGMVTMVTSSGATITSGSATLGKMPKSGTRSLSGGLKSGGHDGGSAMGHHDDSFLPMSARSTLQYRSLPRPSRSGAAARNGNRSSTSSIEAAVLSVTSHGKNSFTITKPNGAAGLLANQTDREKGVSEVDNLRSGGGMQSGGAATGRQQVSSPTLRSLGGVVGGGNRRVWCSVMEAESYLSTLPSLMLFGGKANKQAPVTTAENLKNSTVISNPHATMNHVPTVLESPDGVLGGSIYSSTGPSNSLTWGTTFSGSSVPSRESTLGGHGGAGSMGFPSVSSMHTSSESIDMSLSSAGGGGGGHGTHREDTLSALGRTGSVKTGMSERYGPSQQLRGHEDRDWLRSHSTSGLQDSASNSPFSPGSSLTSPSGTRFNFGQLGRPLKHNFANTAGACLCSLIHSL